MKRLALLLWLVASLAWAQDVTITAPSKVTRGSFAMVTVKGLTADELAKAQVGIVPADPKILSVRMPTADSTAVYFLAVFEDAAIGQRTFRVSLNPWRAYLDEAAAQVAGIDEADAKRLKDLATEFQKYPTRASSAVLEVTSNVPFQPVDPLKPPPVDPNQPNKVTRVTYVFEKDQNNPPRQVSFALTRLNADSSRSVVATEFEEDTVDGTGQVPDQYKIALDAARTAGLPALVVQAGNTVLRVVKNPTTEQQVLEAAK